MGHYGLWAATSERTIMLGRGAHGPSSEKQLSHHRQHGDNSGTSRSLFPAAASCFFGTLNPKP